MSILLTCFRFCDTTTIAIIIKNTFKVMSKDKPNKEEKLARKLRTSNAQCACVLDNNFLWEKLDSSVKLKSYFDWKKCFAINFLKRPATMVVAWLDGGIQILPWLWKQPYNLSCQTLMPASQRRRWLLAGLLRPHELSRHPMSMRLHFHSVNLQCR